MDRPALSANLAQRSHLFFQTMANSRVLWSSFAILSPSAAQLRKASAMAQQLISKLE
jgi:hypothetical protein